MLGRQHEKKLIPSLLLAVVFPSGLILANTRATYEAFFSTRMDFNRTTRAGEAYAGGWRGGPELLVGVLLPLFVFAEQTWSGLFFFFAVAGLVSIGAMGATSPAKPVRQQITPWGVSRAPPSLRSGGPAFLIRSAHKKSQASAPSSGEAQSDRPPP